MVITSPATTPKKTLNAPLFWKFARKDTLSALISGIMEESISSPKNKRPNPIKASPMASFFSLFTEISRKPIPNIGIAKAEMSNLNPKRETIQAVMVVPIFAPKITPTDCFKVKSPAFTKDTTITVVALED